MQGLGNGMIIIGEKLNGAIPRTSEAIRKRDEAYVLELVKRQLDAGADYLDICAGTNTSDEYDALRWLIEVVQSATDTPICIDSPDASTVEKIFKLIKTPGIINSISGEDNKCEILLPLIKDNPGWQVLALCCDNKGIGRSAEDKLRIADYLLEKSTVYGIEPERVYIDPLVLALSVENYSAVEFCRATRHIKALHPKVNVVAALSNISYGMPARSLLNRNFLTMAMCAGLDAVICDPTNSEVVGNIFSTDALLGRDNHCRKYNNAFRVGRFESVK